MVKAGKVFATATEDMDALTFGTNVLLRHLTFSEARKMPIQEFHLDKVLSGLEMDMNQVISSLPFGCTIHDSIGSILIKFLFNYRRSRAAYFSFSSLTDAGMTWFFT